MKKQIEYMGVRKIYESSLDVYRGFCQECGTPLTYEAKWCEEEVHLYICTLDNPEKYVPEKHVFYQEHIPWFDVNDHLPRFDTSSRNKEPSSWGPLKS